MTAPSDEALSRAFEQSKAVRTLHPDLTVRRDEMGFLDIDEGFEGKGGRVVVRKINVHPTFFGKEDNPPAAVAIGVYDGPQKSGIPSTHGLIRCDQGDFTLRITEGAKIDLRGLLATTIRGMDLFDQYLGLNPDAQKFVYPSRIEDKTARHAHLRKALGQVMPSDVIDLAIGADELTPTASFMFMKNVIARSFLELS